MEDRKKNGESKKPTPADRALKSTAEVDRDLRSATERLNQLRDSL